MSHDIECARFVYGVMQEQLWAAKRVDWPVEVERYAQVLLALSAIWPGCEKQAPAKALPRFRIRYVFWLDLYEILDRHYGPHVPYSMRRYATTLDQALKVVSDGLAYEAANKVPRL